MNLEKIFGLCFASLLATASPLLAADKKIVLVAGAPSHGPGEHEHNAGVLLLKKCLDDVPGVKAEAQLNGWPKDESVFDGADAIVLYMDGGSGHGALQQDHLAKLDTLMKKGVGLACLHYAVEPTLDKGEKEFLDWIGGAFEINWSVNPHWNADFTKFPKHPITRGVKPFQINDEWYFNMRFRDGMKGVTPILSAVPTPDTTSRKDGEHEGNPAVRDLVKRGIPQTVAWAATREGGGRGFGFTGAHAHKNWGDENFRKIVLNAILWIAKAEVPKNGVESKINEEDLKKNLDPKGEKKAAVKAPAPVAQRVDGPQPKFKSGIIQSGRVSVDVDVSGAKGLWLVVTDGGNGFQCDWADWIEPTLQRADGSVVKLTSLKWKSATTGFGSVGINQNAAGGPLLVEKKKVKDGIGTHAPSLIEYDFSGETFTRFTSKAGPDDGGVDQGGGTQIEFMVFTEKPAPAL
ncbi:MAG: NPCBM/NEW2 domain-containing protein, partial [Verrucomicrobiota bacterium]